MSSSHAQKMTGFSNFVHILYDKEYTVCMYRYRVRDEVGIALVIQDSSRRQDYGKIFFEGAMLEPPHKGARFLLQVKEMAYD